MSNQELVREIVDRVITSLKLDPAASVDPVPVIKRVMVVVTGATIGAKAALEGLACLKKDNGKALEYILLFSRAAAAIHKPEEVAELLDASDLLVEGKNTWGRATQDLKRCNLVAVPTLTRTTAARTALLLLDTAATEVIVDALMRGQPVIAARDAADPSSAGFDRLGLNQANPALIRNMTTNLEKITDYGVTLTSSEDLHGVVEKLLFQRLKPQVVSNVIPRAINMTQVPGGKILDAGFCSRRAIITRADLSSLVGSDGVVRVAKGSLVTPLVLDTIRDAGWRLEEI